MLKYLKMLNLCICIYFNIFIFFLETKKCLAFIIEKYQIQMQYKETTDSIFVFYFQYVCHFQTCSSSSSICMSSLVPYSTPELLFTFRDGLHRMNTTVSDRTAENCTIPSSVDQQMYPAAYSLFFIVSFPANLLSLFAAWQLMKKGNNIAVYLVFLSISDLLYTITLPVWIEQALRRDVHGGLCSTVNLIMYNSFYVGSGLLCCISVDRYLAVVYPLHFHWVREVCTAVALSTAVWILEVVAHILLLFHMGALRASLCLYEQHIPIKTGAAHVFLFRIIVGFLIPVVIMSFCFQQIMHSLQQNVSILEEERRRVCLLLLLLLLTYIASFLPYQTVMLLRATLEPGSCEWAQLLRGAYLVTSAMTTLNSTLDPIIYCLINTSARTEIKIFVEKGRKVFMREDEERPNSSIEIRAIC